MPNNIESTGDWAGILALVGVLMAGAWKAVTAAIKKIPDPKNGSGSSSPSTMRDIQKRVDHISDRTVEHGVRLGHVETRVGNADMKLEKLESAVTSLSGEVRQLSSAVTTSQQAVREEFGQILNEINKHFDGQDDK